MGGPAPASGRSAIRNPQDFYGGLALVGLAALAFWASRELEGAEGYAFGSGTAPRLFAGLLGLAGTAVAALGLVAEGPMMGRYAWRGPLLVTASVLVFAASIRPLGMVVATFAAVLAASAASPETRWREAVAWAAALTAFSTLLFAYALRLSLPVWPRIG